MRCSRIRADNTPMTNPLPMIGRRAMGNMRRDDGGRNAMTVPTRAGSPITRVFSREKSSLERKAIFLPATT
jgi:hypothetical protein